MRSRLMIESAGGFGEVVDRMIKYEGITKEIRIVPGEKPVIIAEVEIDSPQKLNLFIKEELGDLKNIKPLELIYQI